MTSFFARSEAWRRASETSLSGENRKSSVQSLSDQRRVIEQLVSLHFLLDISARDVELKAKWLTIADQPVFPTPTAELPIVLRPSSRSDSGTASRNLSLSEHVTSPGFGGFYQGRSNSVSSAYPTSSFWQRQCDPQIQEAAWRHQDIPDIFSYAPTTPLCNTSRSSVTPTYRFTTPGPERRGGDPVAIDRPLGRRYTNPYTGLGVLPGTWPFTNQGSPPPTPFVSGDWSESVLVIRTKLMRISL
jgi:hypothetical protein